jgi:hypothetical protein
MKKEQDYIRDISEIRSMMEKSSKFMSLSGWAGIMAGLYSLSAAYITYSVFEFNPSDIVYSSSSGSSFYSDYPGLILLALAVLSVSLVTAIYFSRKKAKSKGENVWNTTSKRLLTDMAIPLTIGGFLILILISKNLIGLIAPMMLLFYGISLLNAAKYTIIEVKCLGLVQISLGLLSSYFIEHGLLLWAIGFGVGHIIYGIYMYFRYEK